MLTRSNIDSLNPKLKKWGTCHFTFHPQQKHTSKVNNINYQNAQSIPPLLSKTFSKALCKEFALIVFALVKQLQFLHISLRSLKLPYIKDKSNNLDFSDK